MSPRTGRPPIGNPKTESFHIRVTPDEKKEITQFAKKAGYTLLELIKIGIDAAKKNEDN